MKLSALALSLTIFSTLIFTQPVFAQSTGLEPVFTFNQIDPKAVNGDIMVKTPTGFSRADSPNSIYLFGVLEDKPVIVYRSGDDAERPIARTGVVNVNVTNLNGKIKSGDFITSSTVPGKGQKATNSGYVLGVALTDLPENNQPVIYQNQQLAVGQIPVAMRIEYAEISNPRSVLRLLEYFNATLFQSIQNPDRFLKIIQYFAAGIVVVISFLLGFFIFGRSATKGPEAIGRNPLAKRAIQASIAMNIFLTIVTISIGLVAAFIILRL